MSGRGGHSRLFGKAVAAAAAFLVLSAPGPSGALAGQQAGRGTAITVDSIVIEGNRRLEAQSLVARIGIRPGQQITYRDIQRGLKNLMAPGDIRDVVVRAPEGQSGLLVFAVEEQPILRRVTITGLEHASEREVRDTTGLRGGTPYSPQKVIEAKAFIRSELADEGIPFAQIEDRTLPVSGQDNEVDLVLDVNEGNRVTVSQVEVVGNQQVSDEAIRGTLGSRPEGFWWFQAGTFDELGYQTDIQERLPSLYRSRGFLDFQVLSDTVVIDPQTGKARLEIAVEEGQQYRLGTFTINGNTVFTDEELERHFATRGGGLLRSLGIGGGSDEAEAGQIFDQLAFNDGITLAREQYANQGYLYTRVNPIVRRNPGDDGEPPTVDVTWEIQEGEPAYVNRVSIAGNEHTYDWVIRNQVFVLPGDVYSQSRVLQSYQNISALGFFETPLPLPDIQTLDNGDVNVTFNVAEKQTGTLNFGTSVGGGVGLSGFLGYSEPNLFGQAKSGSLRWDFGRFLKSFEVSFTDPALFQSLYSGTISLFNSTDKFIQFRTGSRRRIGASTRIGFPWPASRYTRFFVGYSLSRTNYDLREGVDDTSLFGLPPGVQSQLTLGVTRSTLDHPTFPTTGSRQSLNTEINGGFLGGDGNFQRVLGEGRWWVPVGRFGGGDNPQGGASLALGMSLEGGAVFGNARAFPFDRFWMGGVQFGQSLRGYEETTITPFGHFPRGDADLSEIDRLGDAFMRATAEIAMRLGGTLSVSMFYDAGSVWSDPAEFDPTRLFRGAGFGVQIVTPFGPLGLDYAYGFDRRDANGALDPGWRLHFKMGPGF